MHPDGVASLIDRWGVGDGVWDSLRMLCRYPLGWLNCWSLIHWTVQGDACWIWLFAVIIYVINVFRIIWTKYLSVFNLPQQHLVECQMGNKTDSNTIFLADLSNIRETDVNCMAKQSQVSSSCDTIIWHQLWCSATSTDSTESKEREVAKEPVLMFEHLDDRKQRTHTKTRRLLLVLATES